MPTSRTRRLLALVAPLATAALIAAPASGLASARPHASAGRCASNAGQGWSSLTLPLAATAFAEGPTGTLVVSDGGRILRSVDDGCSWAQAFSRHNEPAAPLSLNQQSTVTELAAGASGHHLALVEGVSVGLGATAGVLYSADDARTWHLARGLPALSSALEQSTGLPRRIAFAPLSSRIAYVVLCPFSPIGLCSRPDLYASADGGASWVKRSTIPASASDYNGVLAIDPTKPSHLWAGSYTPDKLQQSTDGGLSWSTVGGALGGLNDLQARRLADGRLRLIGVDQTDFAADTTLRISDDAGRSWRTFAAPLAGIELGIRPSAPDNYVLNGYDSGGRRVTAVFRPGTRRWTTITPPGRPAIEDLAVDDTAHLGLWSRARDSLWRYDAPGTVPTFRTPVRTPARTPAPVRTPGSDPQAVMIAEPSRVRITTGDSRAVTLRLALARSHSPTQIGFVLDATGSMLPVIDELGQALGQLATTLRSDGVPASFGLATFGEYAMRQFNPVDPELNIPYQRLIDLTSDLADLRQAFLSVRSNGGSTDTRTSAIPAIYQAGTGSGQLVRGVGVIPGADIATGQGFDFTDGHQHLLVAATDSDAHRPPGYPGPSLAAAASALTARDIHLVGLDIVDGSSAVTGKVFLTELARQTRTLAAADGADCDADGQAELAAGAPLVCTLRVGGRQSISGSGSRLAQAVEGLLDSLPDPRPLRLRAVGDDGIRVTSGFTPHTVDTHLSAQLLSTTLQVTCPLHPVSSKVRADAVLSGSIVARSTIRVDCELPTTSSPRRHRAGGGTVSVAVAAGAPGPPGPLQHGQAPAAQAATHAVTAAAIEQQDQPQLALADAKGPDEAELAVASGLAVAAVTATATAMALRARRQDQLVHRCGCSAVATSLD